MTGNSDPIALTPLDHTIARFYIPYILHFNTADTKTALQTIENGIKNLVSHLPWLAGEVVLRGEPSGPQNRGYIVPPSGSSSKEAVVSMLLQVKHFDHDEDYQAYPTQTFLPVSGFIPVSQQRPVLRFQASVFPSKVVLVMSFFHFVLDGTGAGMVLEALAQCCKATATDDNSNMTIAASIAKNEVDFRKNISSWSSRCKTRLDHSLDLAPPFFDSSLTSERWAAMEAAMSSAVETKRFTFSPEKVARVKKTCNDKFLPKLQSPSSFVSSNDIITAILGISVDRALNPMRGNTKNDKATVSMTVDLRSRVQPPLPDTFLGNMSFPVRSDIYFSQNEQAAMEETDFLHLTQVAYQLRDKLDLMDETLAYSVSAAVVDQEDWGTIEAKPGNVIVTSWRHLKVFSLDFGEGLGKIIDFEMGLSLVPGACIFMPSRAQGNKSKDGSAVPWEVCITLRSGDFDVLVNDPLFGRIVA